MGVDKMGSWKVLINTTFEYVEAETPEEAVEKAKKRYLGQLSDTRSIIEIKGVVEL